MSTEVFCDLSKQIFIDGNLLSPNILPITFGSIDTGLMALLILLVLHRLLKHKQVQQ